VNERLVLQEVGLPRGPLRLLQPSEATGLPDAGAVEWAPLTPYWSVLWRSGVALAHDVEEAELEGQRVVELGCGLAVPSIAAARCGAQVLATDESEDALELVPRNAAQNGTSVETLRVDWADPDELIGRGPFDLVLAADVLYQRSGVAQLLELLPRLAPVAWIADPGRPAASAFLAEALRRGRVESRTRGVVNIHRVSISASAVRLKGDQTPRRTP
jgi:predicted nicotinamide N-methyase